MPGHQVSRALGIQNALSACVFMLAYRAAGTRCQSIKLRVLLVAAADHPMTGESTSLPLYSLSQARYIGGEGPLAAPSDRLFMYALAEEHAALVLALEHRFYGESRPTADMSDDNLRYLTSAQALADLASFKDYAVRRYGIPATTPWVAIGGSYPGMLAAFVRAAYPTHFAASVASSAPVLPPVCQGSVAALTRGPMRACSRALSSLNSVARQEAVWGARRPVRRPSGARQRPSVGPGGAGRRPGREARRQGGQAVR